MISEVVLIVKVLTKPQPIAQFQWIHGSLRLLNRLIRRGGRRPHLNYYNDPSRMIEVFIYMGL